MGLLLLRVSAGIAVIAHGIASLGTGLPTGSLIIEILAMAAGGLLLLGLWTPLSGSLVGIFGVWNTISHAGDPWASVLLGSVGAGLALLGPGMWSVDARLFGWRRIDINGHKG